MIRHARVGPGIDVGACGARDRGLAFAQTLTKVTCERCRELRSNKALQAAQVARFRKAKGRWASAYVTGYSRGGS